MKFATSFARKIVIAVALAVKINEHGRMRRGNGPRLDNRTLLVLPDARSESIHASVQTRDDKFVPLHEPDNLSESPIVTL